MQINILLRFGVITFITCSSYAIANALRYDRLPRTFDDKFLPSGQRNGQHIDHLGHLIKLNTWLSPKNIDHMGTKFSIYNRQKSTQDISFTPSKFCLPSKVCYGPYQYDIVQMASSAFNVSSRTVIMISGFLSEEHTDWMERSKDTWLQLDPDADVILVSWKDSNRYIYSRAVAVTPLVARQVTIFLHYLAELNGIHLNGNNENDKIFRENIHFVGHSLGAHIGGFVGQDLGGKMGRITGLDPAGPSFDSAKREHRLDRSDARLVVAIHTNGGKLSYMNLAASGATQVFGSVVDKLPVLNRFVNSVKGEYTGEGDTAWFGINQQVGHIDYYANNGKVQPGCAGLLHSCDHARVNEIYNDILVYELGLKHQSASLGQDAEMWRKQNRLLAFQSKDYQSFLTGESLKNNCPSVLEGSQKIDNATERAQQFKRCSIPIDLLTPVDELEDELINDYNVNLMKDHQSKVQYFFKTLSDRPFIGDHYLLKIRLGESTSWHSSCSFEAELKMEYGVSEVIKLNKQLPLVDGNNFFGLAMPFVNPIGADARAAFVSLRDTGFEADKSDILDWLMRMLPTEVSLRISGSKSTGVAEVLVNRLIRLGFPAKASDKCRLDVESIEIHPITSSRKNVVGLYGWQGSRQAEGTLQVLQPNKYKTLAPLRYASEESDRMLTKAHPTRSIRLDGVVIG